MTTFTGQMGAIILGVSNAVAEVRNFEITQTGETLDDTVMGDTWRTNKSTFKTWSGSCDVLFDDDDTNGQNALVVGAQVAGKFYPSVNAVGAAELSGNIRITERTIKTSYDGLVEMTVQFIGDGALVEGDKA
jgi:hypothetical protein